jgi:dephospho-CoA kinase
MPSFGLTGGIASGKSTVAAMFQDLGAKIINADRLAHELIRAGSAVFTQIVTHFGNPILDAEGQVNRKKLGEIVFADPAERAALNAIIHPAIMVRRKELIARYEAADRHAVVISDAALIYEAHIEDYFLKVVVAWCRPEQQLERLISKTRLSREQADRRIAAQMPTEEKRRRADYVIDCSFSIEETRQQVAALYPELKRVAKAIESSGDRAIG